MSVILTVLVTSPPPYKMALKNTDEKANCAIDKIILKSNYRSSHKFLDAFCINRQALYVILMYQSNPRVSIPPSPLPQLQANPGHLMQGYM